MLIRDGILMKRGLLPALVLTLLVFVISALAGYAVYRSASEKQSLVRTALVDEDDAFLSRMALSLVQDEPYIKNILNFVPATREEAFQGIEDGTFAAAVVLPAGYIDQIRHGVKGVGEIYLSDAAASSVEAVRVIAAFGEILLIAAQQSIFTGQDLIWERGLPNEIMNRYLEKSNSEILGTVFQLFDSATVLQMTDYDGSGLSMAACYAVSWFSFFLLLSGLFFVKLYTADVRKGLLLRLYSGRVTPFGFLAGKILYPFCYRAMISVPILIVLRRFMPLTVSAGSILLFLAGLFIATVMTSAGAVLFSSAKGWPGVFAGIFAIGLFLAGGLVPRAFLPDFVPETGRFLPVGMVNGFLSPLFGGEADWLSIGAGVLLAATLFVLSVRFLRAFPEKGDQA